LLRVWCWWRSRTHLWWQCSRWTFRL